MKILAIGNSFSQDATRYLHQIARADQFNLQVVNAYRGGCPLSYHYANTLSDETGYDLEFNGFTSGFRLSIRDALESGAWNQFDVITVQQVSHQSFDYDNYQPYLNGLVEFIRKYAPKTKLYVHQTWAYLKDSPRLAAMGFATPEEMFAQIKPTYDIAAKEIGADGIIPSGEAFRKLMDHGVYYMHRDNIHASSGFGRYVLGLTWYETLTGRTVANNSFCDFDEPVTAEEIALAKKVAHEAAEAYRSLR